ncbi:hypothetical protein RJ640_020351 [Escallonia rubra]|uniref:Cytochrome P450 n=1 Tax=Escallonia rubra TaxID=112253 RepID=A0AA88QGL8_9ASTE|nr:hypothetical protein RJ640_020351 [Escallonia rubra]
MDFVFSVAPASIFAFLLFLCSLLWISKNARRINSKHDQTPPEASGAWPVIGHLHLLGGPQMPHMTLASMADKYGPIFTMKLGLQKLLVVSDRSVAKECLTTNDMVFSSRPNAIATEIMGYNYAMFGLGPYGPYWRHVRKIVVLEILSNRRLEMLGHIRVAEVKAFIKDTYNFCLKNKDENSIMIKMEMKQWFGSLVANMVVKLIAGKRFSHDDEEGERFQKAIRKFFELLGAFVVGDVIPYLRWLDLGGYEKAMKEIAKEIDYILQGWLEEHKMTRTSRRHIKGEEQDFMDVMLTVFDGASPEELGGFDADTVNKATCLVMLSGGTDTTIVTLTWALCLLLNNPRALERARDELDTHVGRERQVEESDMKNLVYLQAIVKETLRLYPAAPLMPPREAMEDCLVGGYKISKGTRLLVNLWKVHRDPHVWPEPNEFRPERFLTSHKELDVRGQHFELIPFGSGRRVCPGISLALQSVQLVLAHLIHGFEVAKPSDEPIDMTESFGLTTLKATPLDVLLSPRLSPKAYEHC